LSGRKLVILDFKVELIFLDTNLTLSKIIYFDLVKYYFLIVIKKSILHAHYLIPAPNFDQPISLSWAKVHLSRLKLLVQTFFPPVPFSFSIFARDILVHLFTISFLFTPNCPKYAAFSSPPQISTYL